MRKKKRAVKGKQAGVAVSPRQKEQMMQLYAVEGNFTEVARHMDLSTACVTKHIKAMLASEDPSVLEARRKTITQLAGKVQSKTNEIIDAIQPHDMESGVIRQYNDKGELTRVQAYGPSLMQKVTAAAILTDKMRVLRDVEVAMQSTKAEGGALMPAELSGLLSGIRGKLKSLSILNVQFADENKDLVQRAQQRLEEAEVLAANEVEVIDLTDFDGND